jgi:hypothetical protein
MQLCAGGGTKMKKAEKIELAEKCFKRIKELSLDVKIEGMWFVFPPTISKDLLLDIARCDTNHLAKLIKSNNTQNETKL